MKVYRWHHSEDVERGLYRAAVSSQLHDDYKHPNPFSDPSLMKAFAKEEARAFREYHFGFRDLKQMRAWVPSRIARQLYEDGFTLSSFEAEEVLLGEQQLMFHLETSVWETHINFEEAGYDL